MKLLQSVATALVAGTITVSAQAVELSIQSRYPPLQFTGSTPGGAHPIGGMAMNFVNEANKVLEPHDLQLKLHVSGKVNKFDADTVGEPLVNRTEWGTLLKAVAAGPNMGGLAAYIGVPANSKLSFGEYFSGGIPFGLTGAEWLGFIYGGGGLELHQQIYDEAFEGKVKVIPVGIAPSQTAGFFPKPIPTGGNGKTSEQAMAEFCPTPLIVRYPEGARYVIGETCKAVGEKIDFIGKKTRCESAKAACGVGHANNAGHSRSCGSPLSPTEII